MRSIKKYTYAIILFLISLIIVEEVYAQYGTSRRVARRTARRTSRRVNYRQNNYEDYGYYGGGAAGVVTSLPGGCSNRVLHGVAYQYCGGRYYQPFYQGSQVVYQVVEP